MHPFELLLVNCSKRNMVLPIYHPFTEELSDLVTDLGIYITPPSPAEYHLRSFQLLQILLEEPLHLVEDLTKFCSRPVKPLHINHDPHHHKARGLTVVSTFVNVADFHRMYPF